MKIVFEDKDLEELWDTGDNRKYRKYAQDPMFMKNLKQVIHYLYTVEKASDLGKIGRLNYKHLEYEYKGQSSIRVMYKRVERILFAEYEDGIRINILQLDNTHYGNKK